MRGKHSPSSNAFANSRPSSTLVCASASRPWWINKTPSAVRTQLRVREAPARRASVMPSRASGSATAGCPENQLACARRYNARATLSQPRRLVHFVVVLFERTELDLGFFGQYAATLEFAGKHGTEASRNQ